MIAEEPDMCFHSPEWREILLACSLSKELGPDIMTKVKWVSEAVLRSTHGPISHETRPGKFSLNDWLESLATSGLVDIDVCAPGPPPSRCMIRSVVPSDYPDRCETSATTRRSYLRSQGLSPNTLALTESTPYSDSHASSLSESTDYGLFYTRRGLSPSPSLQERPVPITFISGIPRLPAAAHQPVREASSNLLPKVSSVFDVTEAMDDDASESARSRQDDLRHNHSKKSQTLSYRSTEIPCLDRLSSPSFFGNPIDPKSQTSTTSGFCGPKASTLFVSLPPSGLEQSPPAYTRHAPKIYLSPERPDGCRDLKPGQETIVEEGEDSVLEDKSGNASRCISPKPTVSKEAKCPPGYKAEEGDWELVDNNYSILAPFPLDEIPHNGDIGMRKERIDEQTLLKQENRRLKATLHMLESALIRKDDNLKSMSERLETYRTQARERQADRSRERQQRRSDISGHGEDIYGMTIDHVAVATVAADGTQPNEGIPSASGEVVEVVSQGCELMNDTEGDKTLVQGNMVVQAFDQNCLHKAVKATQTMEIQPTSDPTSVRIGKSPSAVDQDHLNTTYRVLERSEGVSEPEPSFYQDIRATKRPTLHIPSVLNHQSTRSASEEPDNTFETYDTGVTLVEDGLAFDWLSKLVKEPRSQSKMMSNLKDEVRQLREATKIMEAKLGILPFMPLSYSGKGLAESKNIGARQEKESDDGGIGRQLKELYHNLDQLENKLAGYKDSLKQNTLHLKGAKDDNGLDPQESLRGRIYKPKDLVDKLDDIIWSMKEERERLVVSQAPCHHCCNDDNINPCKRGKKERLTETHKRLDPVLLNSLERRSRRRAPLFTRWRDDTEEWRIGTRSRMDCQKRRKKSVGLS